MEKKTLKAMRLQRCMSQREFADEIGISMNALINYEKGKTFPNVPTIYMIENALGIPFCDIDFLC